MSDDDPEFVELTPIDLDARWKPEPLADRPTVRTRYLGPDGTRLVLEHPGHVTGPPTIDLHDLDLGVLRFYHQGTE